MSEKLTKSAIKSELQRRIDYFEKTCDFCPDLLTVDIKDKNHHVLIMFGRYRALLEQKWQVENNMFIGGYTS